MNNAGIARSITSENVNEVNAVAAVGVEVEGEGEETIGEGDVETIGGILAAEAGGALTVEGLHDILDPHLLAAIRGSALHSDHENQIPTFLGVGAEDEMIEEDPPLHLQPHQFPSHAPPLVDELDHSRYLVLRLEDVGQGRLIDVTRIGT